MGTTRRPAQALARPQSPGIRLRLRLALVVAVVLLAVAGLLYLAARETSVFAVRTIEVTGSQPGIVEAARRTLAPLVGESLVSIDTEGVEAQLRALPSVRAATVDRDFPGTLRVDVRPERAVGVVRWSGSAWLVAATGRIMRRVDPGARGELPRIWLSPEIREPVPGMALVADEGGAAIAALAALPGEFPVVVRTARGTPDELTLRIGRDTELRLGDARDLVLKLEVASTVLASLPRSQREELGYLDVSLPARPVGGDKSQVEPEG